MFTLFLLYTFIISSNVSEEYVWYKFAHLGTIEILTSPFKAMPCFFNSSFSTAPKYKAGYFTGSLNLVPLLYVYKLPETIN